jgi:hypothetical protein
MYVILCHLPTTYKIARHEIASMRECVLCGDERPHSDLGLVFGECGHYICRACCVEYKDRLNEVTQCFYCRRPTSLKLDGVEVEVRAPGVGEGEAMEGVEGEAVVGAKRPYVCISHAVNYPPTRATTTPVASTSAESHHVDYSLTLATMTPTTTASAAMQRMMLRLKQLD